MSQPMGFLFDDSGKVRGTAGVVVAPQMVVFSPWPTGLGHPRPFAVWIAAEAAPAGEWHLPQAVKLVRVEGSAASATVALVTLVDEVGVFGEFARGPGKDVVLARLQATQDARRTVSELLPTSFPRLGRRASSVATHVASPPVTGRPTPAVPSTFSVKVRPPEVAQRSICRIFRWD